VTNTPHGEAKQDVYKAYFIFDESNDFCPGTIFTVHAMVACEAGSRAISLLEPKPQRK
jgi:hypothetical protein